jgi:hypothetical protein
MFDFGIVSVRKFPAGRVKRTFWRIEFTDGTRHRHVKPAPQAAPMLSRPSASSPRRVNGNRL